MATRSPSASDPKASGTGAAESGGIDVARQLAEHDRLLALTEDLDAATAADAPPAGLPELRDSLNRLVQTHHAHEDWVVYPRLIAGPSETLADAARAMLADHIDFAAIVSRHKDKWTPARIAEDWPGYCREARAKAAMLRTRIERENRELYAPLVQREQLHKAA